MKTKHVLFYLFCATILLTAGVSCKKDHEIIQPGQVYGKLVFKFDFKVGGLPLAVDTFKYVNAAGNNYKVINIQYFLSDFTLHNANGGSYTISENNNIHYIDTDLPDTYSWILSENIPAGNYSSISLTFGIDSIKNKSNFFVNPPESNMFWPSVLGGGYHYMKFNGEWIDTNGNPNPFNFHLGIGQIYDAVHTDSIIAYVQNYFTATLPSSSFVLDSAATREIQIVMNIDSWFDTPHVWNWNHWGGSIMQNEAAQQTARENGADVFTIGYIH